MLPSASYLFPLIATFLGHLILTRSICVITLVVIPLEQHWFGLRPLYYIQQREPHTYLKQGSVILLVSDVSEIFIEPFTSSLPLISKTEAYLSPRSPDKCLEPSSRVLNVTSLTHCFLLEIVGQPLKWKVLIHRVLGDSIPRPIHIPIYTKVLKRTWLSYQNEIHSWLSYSDDENHCPEDSNPIIVLGIRHESLEYLSMEELQCTLQF